MNTLRVRPSETLPSTTLPWLRLQDHFVATVGPAAGTGSPFGPLLVMADATFSPRSRFPLHPHRDMEILSLVLKGELSHHGDQAHGAALAARQAQLISARNGIVHAEGNDTDADTRMLQIWFTPEERGGAPAYFDRTIAEAPGGGRQLVAGDAQMPLRSSARVWWLDLVPGKEEVLALEPGRAGYLLAMEGEVLVAGGTRLSERDGAEVRGPRTVISSGTGAGARALWIDVAA